MHAACAVRVAAIVSQCITTKAESQEHVAHTAAKYINTMVTHTVHVTPPVPDVGAEQDAEGGQVHKGSPLGGQDRGGARSGSHSCGHCCCTHLRTSMHMGWCRLDGRGVGWAQGKQKHLSLQQSVGFTK
jgi:hypothetical protein